MQERKICQIIETQCIGPDVYKIVIEKPQGWENIRPGQFFHIRAGEDWYPLLRRPISVCEIQGIGISFVVRKSGKGTELLCSRKPGESLDLLGPLGNGFTIEGEKVILVGGGIGTAPLLELCRIFKDKDVTVLLGFRAEPYLVEVFQRYSHHVKVATEDGSVGYKGYVTTLLEEELAKRSMDMIYACGPEVMLKEVQRISRRYGVKSQLAMEERMACGVGACLVCSCKVKAGEGWDYVRTCKEGPVFSGDEVMFDE
ncbi:dihydroorotate dehydrogenase electron transfer subunit [Thermotalea metallivorans]|uniref:Dihydroorotate dehydrogenase B (NAD(+)), electron transfer subunit n=1 Tax=Thermotalea metallivorans TaxID=520762 RepID=A0A140L171_9FIRM|nr:dihydroorotate dehydrogenase electron transfer subunit [Thermotalea metallivorans]KXG74296.1 Dihydroorotate dehydrogenase B (NAD(+)), electron transfer subunit [Thermotalea metallivorans]